MNKLIIILLIFPVVVFGQHHLKPIHSDVGFSKMPDSVAFKHFRADVSVTGYSYVNEAGDRKYVSCDTIQEVAEGMVDLYKKYNPKTKTYRFEEGEWSVPDILESSGVYYTYKGKKIKPLQIFYPEHSLPKAWSSLKW